ncbi:amino acid adenylation domain-containing protein [Streptomyces sp. 8N616]|uniref:amino acid adenylation domain-containing protein n=1 Tax=Streptomyces sp. 8N616 TaxID=3457414 RepID=UPI003FD18719
MNPEQNQPAPSDAFPASSAQQRLWFLQHRHPDSRAYTETEAIWLRGPVDADALERALAALIERHDQLRAVFDYRDDGLVQRIPPAGAQPFRLARQTVARADLPRWFAEETARGFDLAQGPVHRITLLELGENERVLAFCAHHIVTDGWSAGLFFADLGTAYRAECDGTALHWETVPADYREAVAEERKRLDAPGFAAKLDSAAAPLDGASFALDLPTDGASATEPAPAGTLRVPLPASLVTRLESRAVEHGATPFMLYAAAYAVLLSRYTGQDDLVIGLPAAGRELPSARSTYGLFVNTLPLRIRTAREDSWADLIARVRDAALEAYTYADVPLDQLAARLGGMPLQAMLVVQPDEEPLPELPGVEAARWFVEHHHTKFDLLLQIDKAYALRPGADEPEHGCFAALEFRAESLRESRASRMLAHWQQILTAMAEAPTGRVADLDLHTPAERELRQQHRRFGAAPPSLDPLTAFQELAVAQPDAPAVWSGEQATGYGALAARTGAIQTALQQAGVRPGDFVGVCLRRTPDLVAALQAILRCGAAYVPLDATYPRDRLLFIAQDARCKLVLTEPDTQDVLPADAGPTLDVRTVPATAELPPAVPSAPERIAYLIYTSGSTGRPKGVAIPHRAFHAFLGWARGSFAPEDLAVVLAGTSVCFDLSVFELFLPLSVGGSLRLVDNALQLTEQPGTPPTLINTVPSAMTELLRAGALPAATRVVNLAGEALTRALVDSVHAQSETVRVHNLYGPSEDTTYSTWCEVPRGRPEEPSIGGPIEGSNAYVLDDRLMPVPVGVDGELFLGGLGVAQGYLDRPDLTAERFLPDPFTDRPGARMYRTGDRVRLTETGELRYLGRYDHQIKLRGFRIETGEIESRARAVPGVTHAVVTLRTVADTPHLVCYWTGGAEAEALRTALAAELPDYMVPRYWMPLPEFPLNANGKTDRAALPEPARDTGGETALTTGTERGLAGLMAQLTKSGPLGADADFFALGGHSLLAMQLMLAVRDRLGAEITLSDIFNNRSVRALAARIDQVLAHQTALPPLRRRRSTGPAPLAFAQERMWLVEQLRPGSAMLNIGVAVRTEGELSRDALRRALQALTDRHDALRLRIDRGPDGRLVQQAAANQPVLLHELTSTDEATTTRVLRDAAAAPFDLATEPPARWLLVEEPSTADGKPCSVLGLVIHHVVADAWSLRLLFNELFADYAAALDRSPVSTAPSLSVLDYGEWQRDHLDHSATIRRDLAYWQDRLAALPGRLQLGFDHPPAEAVSFRGARLMRRLPDEAVDALLAVGRTAGATAFSTMLTLYQGLMARLSGQDDIVVGTPIAGRDQSGTEGLVGCLLNTLALRADLSGEPSFGELLVQTRQRCLEAFDHQQTPFELVVSALEAERTVEHTPVFQTMFVLDDAEDSQVHPRGLTCTPLDVPPVATQYDLTLMVGRDEHGWHATWDYRTDLFEQDTVARYAGCFDALLAQAAGHPERPLGHLPLCDAAREQALLAQARPEATPVPATLPDLFAAQVAAHPDAPALRDDEGALSYRELDSAAGRLARRLLAHGVRPDDRVAIVLPRSRASVIAMLAVAKAGGAFLCLDPGLPAERMIWIARDAGVRLQLTDARLAGRLDPAVVPALRVDESVDTAADAEGALPPAGLTPEHLAYVIYTSGSTGRPKGVLLAHRGLAQLQALHRDRFAVGPGAQVLQYAPYSFDASVWECVMGLLSGACLHLTHPDALLPGAPLAGTLKERGITHLTMPPSNLAMLDALPGSLRHLVLAGEALPAELVHRVGRQVHLWNAYGPSEATVCSSIQDCEGLPAGQAPSIGTAFPGAQAYVLDAGMNVLPPGVPGELYLGGQGLARGYLDRPELTASTFVPHPYATTPGERLYRTGDLARLTAAGEIEFLGRIDDQIKLRGIRIELGEIERVLAGLDPRIADAAVVVSGSGGDQHLIGFVAGPAGIDPAALRDALAARLPGYMVPAWLERLDSFPLNGNGKLDRKAFARRAADRRPPDRVTEPPRGPLEQEVAAIWRELLPHADVGRKDSFFAIGGTSLTLTRLYERLDARYSGALKLVDLFRLNTVAAIATALEDTGAVTQAPATDLSFRL